MKKQLISIYVCAAITAAAQARAADPAGQIEEIEVTGTRIQHVGMTTPTPVTSVTLDELTSMAPTTLIDALIELPQFYGSATTSNFNTGANGFFTSPGGGSLDLRGLGTKRTLTLLDGRRMVDSSLYGGPDINLFPQAVIKRVDTVTGGASAAYGTDAVAGVVNFILDTKFNGLKGTAQDGQTSRGDNKNNEFSLTYGQNLGEHTHIIVSGEHYAEDPIYTYSGRSWYQSWGLLQSTAANPGNSQSNPKFYPAPYVTSLNASYDGIITGWTATPGNTVPATFGRMIFNSDGQVSPFVPGSQVSTLTNAQSTLGGGSGTDNNSERPDVEPQSSRNSFFTYIDSDVTPNINVYFQGLYANEMVKTTNSGGLFSSGSGQQITIFANNAYLPASLSQAMAANNIASFNFGRIGDSLDIADDAYVEDDTKVRSGTLGFKSKVPGGFFKDWSVDGNYQFGETNLDARQIGGIRLDRIFMALDAVKNPTTGQIECNVTLTSGQYPGCVPLDLFGRGNASPAAIDWVTGYDPGVAVTTTPYYASGPQGTFSYIGGPDKVRDVDIQQSNGELVASGDVYKGWGAGAVSVAFGGTYRRETLNQVVFDSQGNPSTSPSVLPVPANNATLGIRGVPPGAANNSVDLQFSKVPFVKGEFDVKEAFAETEVPLVANTFLLQQFNFNGAVRVANYSGSGSILAYKMGLDDQVVQDVRLRATYSRDVRAANLDERFDRTGGAASVIDYGRTGNPPESITIVQGGNPAVKPETADTVTAGLVYRPSYLPGADLSVDWFDTSLKNAIQAYTAQQIVTACYQQGNTDQCANISHNPDGSIFIVNQTYQNISKAEVGGVDIETGYTHSLHLLGGGAETLSGRAFASYLRTNSQTSSTGVKTEDAGDVGTLGLPQWKLTAYLQYANGPFSTFFEGRFIDGGKLSATDNLTGWDVANNHVPSVTYYDMRLSYDIVMGGSTVQLYAVVNNLFDKTPPLAPSYVGLSSAPIQTNQALYDVLGRRFTVGLKLQM
ncbi:MAG TPA: TonB-dependent receptor [Steroidobacteraceae bacterium]|nr:TonB-dependent receptor [Steroidobacteraceae bacterium]